MHNRDAYRPHKVRGHVSRIAVAKGVEFLVDSSRIIFSYRIYKLLLAYPEGAVITHPPIT